MGSFARKLVPVSLRSIDSDLPIVEIRPYRDASEDLTSALLFQIAVGEDVPQKVTALYPPRTPAADLKTCYYGTIRVSFDCGRYF